MRNTRKIKIQKIEENPDEIDLEIVGYLHSDMQWQNSANLHEYKNSYIYLDDVSNSFLKLYYNYIVKLLYHIINQNDLKYNFVISDKRKEINVFNNFNGNKTVYLGVNFEDISLKKNGRTAPVNCPIINENIIDNDNDNNDNLVRIDNFDNLKKMDYVFDYSISNIYNISQCNMYNDFSKKCIYISPYIFDSNKIDFNNIRKNDVITTFSNINKHRIRELYDVLNHADLKWINYDNCFETNELKNLYLNTKIIININQTDHHHSFEELSILPALQCGVIVISEESHLQYILPYKEMIIWCKYNDIVDMTKSILANYDFYYNKIFIEKGHILNTLHQKNIENISKILE